MWQLWRVAHYTHLLGRDGKANHAAAAAHHTKRQHALACLEKAVNFRREDMKKHAQREIDDAREGVLNPGTAWTAKCGILMSSC
jgi:hypothetical protein